MYFIERMILGHIPRNAASMKIHLCRASIAVNQTIHQALCSIRHDRIQRSSDFIPRRLVIDRNTRIRMD